MNWEAIGAVGEVLGALGVIATLGYLAVQIRQNTRSIRDSAFQGISGSVGELTKLLGTNPQSSAVLRRGLLSPDELTEDEWFQFSMLTHSIINDFQNYHWMHERSFIDDSLWEATANNLRVQMKLPGYQAWWKRNPIALTPGFTEYVEREILGNGKD